MKAFFKSYLESGYQPIPWEELSSEDTALANQRFVMTTVAVLPYSNDGIYFWPDGGMDNVPLLKRLLQPDDDVAVVAGQLFVEGTGILQQKKLRTLAVTFHMEKTLSRFVFCYGVRVGKRESKGLESLGFKIFGANEYAGATMSDTVTQYASATDKLINYLYRLIMVDHHSSRLPWLTFMHERCEHGKVYLTDELFGRAFQNGVIVAADAIIVDRKRKTFYLPKRIIMPADGFWFIGGGMLPAMLPEQATAAFFKREAGLDLPIERFKPFAVVDCRWKNRSKPPHDMGCHTVDLLSYVELDSDELVQASSRMEAGEYAPGGLKEFDRDDLLMADARPQIIDLYDHLFSR